MTSIRSRDEPALAYARLPKSHKEINPAQADDWLQAETSSVVETSGSLFDPDQTLPLHQPLLFPHRLYGGASQPVYVKAQGNNCHLRLEADSRRAH